MLRFMKLYFILVMHIYAQETFITHYQTHNTILADNEMRKSETIHFYAKYDKNYRQSYEDTDGLNISSNSPIFRIDLPYQKYLYDFEVFFNKNNIEWHKIDVQNQLILNSVYQSDHHYRYIINYKETLIPQYVNEHTDTIKWDLLNNQQFNNVQHFEAHIHLPEQLNKTNIQVSFSSGHPEVKWINDQYFTFNADDFYITDQILTLSYPKGLMGQTNNPALTAKNTKPFAGSEKLDSLIYWQFVILCLYIVFLYYTARQYGSFAAIGSIPVRYEPPEGISLLQSGYIIDEKNNAQDFLAAVIELASMGYLHIKMMNESYAKDLMYLEKTDKDTDPITVDQNYFLNRMLFLEGDVTQVSSAKKTFFGKFQALNSQLRDGLKLKGILHFDIKIAQRSFIVKSYLAALPVFAFFTYTTFIFYDYKFAGIMIAFMLFFIIYAIGAALGGKDAKMGVYALYFMLLFPFIVLAGSLKVLLVGPMFALPVISLTISYFYRKISHLTGKGLKTYKELLGYKEFVERTELPRLEHLLKDHPEHIEKSLSYALIFTTIKHKFMSKF